MTEHWLKFQNGLSMRSRVNMQKQLKYDQMGAGGVLKSEQGNSGDIEKRFHCLYLLWRYWIEILHGLYLLFGETTPTVYLLSGETTAKGTHNKWRIVQNFIKKIKQHPINNKNYTSHPHDMVHIPAQFRRNIPMRIRVTVWKRNMTDGQMDRRTFQYLPSRAFGVMGDHK